jgi:quinol monooxygenase YgiN
MTPEEYEKVCNSLAPIIAKQPGLIAKVWISDPATNTYGGTYAWRDRQSMDAFMQSDLVKNFASHPSIVGLTSRDFEVLEEPTAVTAAILAVPV